LFGDPEQVRDPVPRLLSDSTAGRAAERIRRAVAAGRALDIDTPAVHAAGTTHLSVADRQGNIVSVTFTHGDAFGARVVVPGFGLILGHGLSRFDPAPGHANGLAPRKRPLHNMCPTVLIDGDTPVAAIGATGGRRIPNAVFDVVTRMLWEKMPLADAVAAPRMNTTGALDLALSGAWPDADRQRFAKLGFQVEQHSTAAVVQALSIRPEAVKASG
jgi:gamma-glutamyltranspeptidase/glutathione hydrolase